MMNLKRFLLGGRDEFKLPAEIVQVIRESPNFHPSKEDTDTAEPLLIFQTSKQQTWLVATTERLYCVLDDLRRSFTRVQWSIPKERLVNNNAVTVYLATRERQVKSDRTGLLDIDARRSWLYSKKLFTSDSIENQIRRLIAGKMLGSAAVQAH